MNKMMKIIQDLNSNRDSAVAYPNILMHFQKITKQILVEYPDFLPLVIPNFSTPNHSFLSRPNT